MSDSPLLRQKDLLRRLVEAQNGSQQDGEAFHYQRMSTGPVDNVTIQHSGLPGG